MSARIHVKCGAYRQKGLFPLCQRGHDSDQSTAGVKVDCKAAHLDEPGCVTAARLRSLGRPWVGKAHPMQCNYGVPSLSQGGERAGFHAPTHGISLIRGGISNSFFFLIVRNSPFQNDGTRTGHPKHPRKGSLRVCVCPAKVCNQTPIPDRHFDSSPTHAPGAY